jgi:hypothetical protein
MRRFFYGSVYIHVQYVPTKKNLLTYLDKTWSACFPVSMTSIFIFIYDNADDEKKKKPWRYTKKTNIHNKILTFETEQE